MVSELARLDAVIAQRIRDRPGGSYTAELANAGIRRIAQQVGEEAVETALAVVAHDEDSLIHEAADLIDHLGVALQMRGRRFDDVLRLLHRRDR